MPRYRIDRREVVAGPTPAEWVEGSVIDTGETAPSAQAPRTEMITGLTNGQEYEFRVVRLDNGTPAASSSERRARPTRFAIDFTDQYSGGVTVTWADQRGGKHYRIDRWTTATDTPSPGDVTSTAVTLGGEINTSGQLALTGLVNGTTYRLQVQRLMGSGGSVARSSAVVQARPTVDFEAPPEGFTADGPSAVSPAGEVKAQFVTSSDGKQGIIITLKNAAFNSLTVAYVQNGVSVSRSHPSTGFAKIGNTQSYFCEIPNLSTLPITVPASDPVENGAQVTLVRQGQGLTFVIQPTYVL